jgi:hypothetical protein
LGYWRDRLDDDARLVASPSDLGSNGTSTEGTQIFVLISLGKDQKQAFADRNRMTAFGTEELGGIEFLE